jgi:hypothetical protein
MRLRARLAAFFHGIPNAFRRNRSSMPTLAALAPAVLATAGCMDATILEYEPLTLDLDGKSELHISTFPSGFPRETSSIPFLYKALRTPESVYFQVFVRDAEKKSGKNPHVESIRIHSFTYEFPGQPPVQLIADYEHNFWMQGSPQYDPHDHAPVPFNEHWHLRLKIDLTLNGEDYAFDRQVHAADRKNLRPLLLYALE